MNRTDAVSELIRRGYSAGAADLAVTRAYDGHGDGIYRLSRHQIQVDTAGDCQITPRAWADGGTLLPEGREAGPLQDIRQHDRPDDLLDTPLTAEQAVAVLTGFGYSPGVAHLAVGHAPGGGGKLAWHEVTTGDGGYIIAYRSRWPDLGEGYDVAEILAALRIVDAHLDDAAPEIYKSNPLANRWRRIAGGPASEGQEAVDALNLATGGNPRKGIIGDNGTILGELGDTAVAALLGIQSIVKDTDVTWRVFTAALAKALSRVPGEGTS